MEKTMPGLVPRGQSSHGSYRSNSRLSSPKIQNWTETRGKTPGFSLRKPTHHHSTLSSPENLKHTAETLFPSWLLNRKDFQELSTQYGNLESVDVWDVCLRPSEDRNKLEKRAILVWMTDSPFLADMKEYQLIDICDRFRSVEFRPGEVVIRKADPADCMYLLVQGHVGIYIDSERLVNCVYPKNVIGELGVQSGAKRTATVIAMTPVKALKLTLKDYDSSVFKIKLQHIKDQSRYLRETPFFSVWDKAKADRLATVLMVKAYHKGQVIYSPGDLAHDMYVMKTGLVRMDAEAILERVNKWPKSPKISEVSKVLKVYQRTLRLCKPGDVFGEVELLENVDRKCFATCMEESLIFVIRREDVDEIFTEREKVKLKSYNQARPPSAQIRNELAAEQNTAFIMRNALLDGIQANFLPNSRSMLLKDIRKQHLAELFTQRHKLLERKKLIRQRKSVEIIDRIHDCKKAFDIY